MYEAGGMFRIIAVSQYCEELLFSSSISPRRAFVKSDAFGLEDESDIPFACFSDREQ